MLFQVLVEYAGTPSQPFGLGGLLDSVIGRWIAIAAGGLAVLILFRRAKVGTLLVVAGLAAVAYYGRSWIGW